MPEVRSRTPARHRRFPPRGVRRFHRFSGRGRGPAASRDRRRGRRPRRRRRGRSRRAPRGLAHHELGRPGELVGDGDLRRRAARSRRSRAEPRRSRNATIPATPSATSVVPCRQARPNESLTITPAAMPVSSVSRSRRRAADASGSSGSRIDRVRSLGVRRVDTRGGAHEPVARLGDHERRARAEDLRGLSPRITSICRGSPSAPASSTRALGRLDLVERGRSGPRPSRPPSARRRRRPLLEPAGPRRSLGEQGAEIVALLELGDALASGITRITTPAPRSVDAGDAETGVCLVALVHVDDHGRHPLERAGARKRAGVDRPARR